ncbi:membrane protein insertase YidC [Bacillus suaedae]|uniref:Membrane protein insertase YidC n=1 Tax=Halalkalibacter suaedae TaxID=2822140 RepID=A0A941AQP2_9BACI|nr:membrane protein insertase YidC [Bacillus suaedae]MBP3951463.1 membrane protein insertase YidC [Bacillus suaedae]
MKKKYIFVLIALLVCLLSACGVEQTPINSESAGVWNHFFVYPLSWLLIFVAEHLSGSYGLSIVIVTIAIRSLLLPLMLKQQKSTRAMQALRPQMEELQKKYKTAAGKADPQKQQEMQKELMGLYQKNGVNPLAGCMPMFVQLPILMAFYYAIMRTEEIALHTFLWMDLGQPDPFYIIPLVAGMTTFLQVRMSAVEGNDQMKVLMYIMPVMIIIAGVNLPSALSLYWVIGNLFMIIQTYFFVTRFKQKQEIMTNQHI